jgi:hypothetical protein
MRHKACVRLLMAVCFLRKIYWRLIFSAFSWQLSCYVVDVLLINIVCVILYIIFLRVNWFDIILVGSFDSGNIFLFIAISISSDVFTICFHACCGWFVTCEEKWSCYLCGLITLRGMHIGVDMPLSYQSVGTCHKHVEQPPQMVMRNSYKWCWLVIELTCISAFVRYITGEWRCFIGQPTTDEASPSAAVNYH